MKRFIKYIPHCIIAINIINLFVAWLNSRDLQKDIDDTYNRQTEAKKAFASMGMTLEAFERPVSESEVPTHLI